RLGNRQAILVLVLGDPALRLQVPLHVARQRDRPAKAEGPETEEVRRQLAQRYSRTGFGDGCHLGQIANAKPLQFTIRPPMVTAAPKVQGSRRTIARRRPSRRRVGPSRLPPRTN